jgi:hypothetical protein
MKTFTPDLDPAVLARLRQYAAHFAPDFPQSKPARWAGVYLQGLLADGERKSIEPLSRRVTLPADLPSADPEQALQQFVKALTRLRAAIGGGLEYARVLEWSKCRPHAHLLVRAAGRLDGALVRGVFEAVRPCAYRVTCQPIRQLAAITKYFVKDLRDVRRKAELTPRGFKGRVFQASGNFLIRSLRILWREIQAERRPRPELPRLAGPSDRTRC